MTRATIDYGIDLGTTNSSIAVLRGTAIEVIKNNEGQEYTPSAVWVDKKGALYVGDLAKQQLAKDSSNVYFEFKLQMGKRQEYRFPNTGRVMVPEELSAEILKSLKADVLQRNGENIQASVITVPAAFELPSCEATKKAAQAAGLLLSPLLQEPVAAALAYGFQSQSDNTFWLAYDFGGGTFDAAVIRVRDGEIQVVNHKGDNQLGGKLIDWAIVEELMIPALVSEHPLTDFRRGNPKWSVAIAKLKLAAEEAKIRVSRRESTQITIDTLCQDDRGKTVTFEYELKKSAVERLAAPFILRSINICKKVLEEKRLGVNNIEKLLLVGGPTLMPYLRERLADPNDGLGIPLEFNVDPLTVVARGAAIFAGMQRLEGMDAPPMKSGQYAVQLEYKPMGSDLEFMVGGRVSAPDGASLAAFSIEFVDAERRPPWRSGKLNLAADGAFFTNLQAEGERQNIFLIELYDSTGTRQEVVPDRLTYTVVQVTVPDAAPLTHSVGVALANNEMEWFVAKGAPLPARRRVILRTATAIRRGQTGQVIRIPVMEGQYTRADRNQRIGSLEIAAEQIKRDLPTGSEVEITIEIDSSRLVRTKAFVPILDEEFEQVISYENYRNEASDPEALKREVERQNKRLEEAREKARQTGDLKARQAVQRIDAECMVREVETSLAASHADPDAADKCQYRLLDLKSAIDEVEEAVEWPILVAEAEKEIEVERKIVNNQEFSVTVEEKTAFTILEREIRNTIGTRDADLLRRKVQEMDRIGCIIVFRQPGWWILQLDNLVEKKSKMSDPAQADIYIAQGQRAIHNNDIESLKAAVRQLASLLPPADEIRAKIDSGVVR